MSIDVSLHHNDASDAQSVVAVSVMTKTPETRKTIALPDEMWDDLDVIQAAEKYGTQTEAVRQVLRLGIAAWKRSQAKRDRDST